MAILLALLGLLLVRHAIVLPLVGTLLPHRVLVLGTGPEARLVEASLASTDPLGMRLVGFYALEKMQETAVSPGRVIARGGSLEDTVRQLGINEVIVAVRQQRGGILPLRALLDCRLNGVQVTDLARYFERVHGQVPIESLKVSWLIYGHGFRQSVLRGIIKRCFDIVASASLIVIAAPVVALAALLIAAEGGGSVIYRQERVGYRGRSFTVYKLRSMSQDAEKDGKARWAAPNDARVTRIGRFIRRTRIDELPQLYNVLKGEMSFVGPRPERPEFVAMLTEQIPFYAVRNSVKPGVTGWAQVRYSYGATVEQSVRKLEYDLYYVKNHTLLLDLVIMLETLRVVLLAEGAR
jgi:sugar transferase (PEP-CTERM system associated)